MNRKQFFKNLIGFAGLSLIGFGNFFKNKKNYKKIKFIAVNHCPVDSKIWEWTIFNGNENLCKNKQIYSANFVEGWYEEFKLAKDIRDSSFKKIYNKNIRLVYLGKNPKYKCFV